MAKVNAHRVKQIIETLFDTIPERSSRDELVFVCEEPGCGDKTGNRSVNLKSGATNCWKCGKGGFILDWLSRNGHKVEDFDDIEISGSGDLDAAVEDLKKLNVGKNSMIAYVNDVKLPRGFISLKDEPNCAYARLIGKMAKRKNLSLDIFIDAGAGFTREDGKWEPFCIFPVYEWGKVVYYQGRTYTDIPGESTKKFPSKYEIQLGSRYWVYNIDKLRTEGKIGIVVESIFNVLSLEAEMKKHPEEYRGVVPIAIFKHNISAEQQAKILTAKGVVELCLMFDSDAISSSWESCKKLANLLKVTVASLPEGVDPNDDAVTALDRFKKRTKYSQLASLDHQLEVL